MSLIPGVRWQMVYDRISQMEIPQTAKNVNLQL